MKTLKSKYMVSLAIISFLVFCFPYCVMAAPINLTACSYVPESHAASKAFAWWLDYLEKESKGRLKFTRYYGGALVAGPDTVAGIGKGIADVGMISAGYVPAKFPLSMVGFLPYITSNPYAFTRARIDLFKSMPEIQDQFKKVNVHWISPVSTAPGYLCSVKPVRKIEDLKGMKIRSYGYATKAVSLLGASPATISYGETFTSLQTKVVEGAVGNSSDISSQKWHEAAKYLVDIDFGMYIVCDWCFNQNSWKAIPKDLQKLIEGTTDLLLKKEFEYFDSLGVDWLRESKKIGCDIYMWPEEEKERAKKMVKQQVIQMWIEEIPVHSKIRRTVVDRYLELISKYEKESTASNPFVQVMKEK